MVIDRIITRPDFDGIVCATLLKHVLGETLPIVWLEPEDVNAKEYEIKTGDVIANLPYSKNCSLYFDHHVTNNPPKDKPGLFSYDPSASGLIYKYYDSKFTHDFSELVFQTDRIDSAALTKDEVLFPEKYPYLLLSMTLFSSIGNNEEYWNQLTDLLLNYDIDHILKIPMVKQRSDDFLNYTRVFKNLLLQHTKITGNIAFSDFRDVLQVQGGNRFLVYAVFPDIDISIKAMQTIKNSDSIHVSIAYNIFRQDKRINIGKMLKKFGGGGHPTAGGITLDRHVLDDFTTKIITRITAEYAGT